jgi:hypothetical protein
MIQEELLDIYTDYLICQNQHASATGLSLLVDGEISHDKITRFLNNNEFSSKDLWKYVKPTVRRVEKETGGVLIIDDAIEEKPYTDENGIICWHFSHAKGRCVKGVNMKISLFPSPLKLFSKIYIFATSKRKKKNDNHPSLKIRCFEIL